MLTMKHLEIYEAFGGDIDGWARNADKGIITDADWYLINELLQNLKLVKSGLTSTSLETTIKDKIFAATENQDVRNRLELLSERNT